MSIRYVRKTGSDSNGGTSPADAWLTMNKLLGAAGVVSGDTAYVGGGVYREAVTVGMTSATAETQIIADVDGSQTGDAGEVRWTAYLTSDIVAPGATTPLILNSRDFLTFKKFVFQAGTGKCVDAAGSSVNCKLEDSLFFVGSGTAQTLVEFTATVDVALNLTIDRCAFFGAGGNTNSNYAVRISAPTSAAADYDLNVLIQNCVATGVQIGVILFPSGAAAFKPGGVDVMNCSMQTSGWGVFANTNSATTIPSTVTNSLIISQVGILAAAAGQVTENFNHIYATTPRTNVTAGGSSVSDGSKALRVYAGQEFLTGRQARPYLSPVASSPLLGAGTATGAPAVDVLGFTRPNPPAIGAHELWAPFGGPVIGSGIVRAA